MRGIEELGSRDRKYIWIVILELDTQNVQEHFDTALTSFLSFHLAGSGFWEGGIVLGCTFHAVVLLFSM